MMAEESNKSSVKVDVGLSAKAEIKGEIPAGSMGRLVDAFTDVIRPFSEARGLRADQIRLQREDVMIKIAQKAQRRIEIEGGTPNPIPNRLLVPLIEKASLTDLDDELLLEAWANLMSSASNGVKANHGIFIDILSKIDSVHLKYLEFLAKPINNKAAPDEFLHINSDIFYFFDKLLSRQVEEIPALDHDEIPSDELSLLCAEFFHKRGSCLISGHLSVNNYKGKNLDYELYGHVNLSDFPEYISGALESLNLIERKRFEWNQILGSYFWVEYHVMTLFGLEFFYAGYNGTNIMTIE
jgi:hypothetical protein